ncbi:hypothetical protein AA313_de0204487 [Arthrobotrys entomopaga]|nr:hypothetical protein AA313_de0204487 [Arthrobotrys entomopaga]
MRPLINGDATIAQPRLVNYVKFEIWLCENARIGNVYRREQPTALLCYSHQAINSATTAGLSKVSFLVRLLRYCEYFPSWTPRNLSLIRVLATLQPHIRVFDP